MSDNNNNGNNNNNQSGYHPATTLLMADGSSRQITEIVPGDLLMGITGNPVRVTNCVRVNNTGNQEHPPVQLFQLNLALNNNPLIITVNQVIFVRNNYQPVLQFEQEGNRTNNYRVYHFNGRNVEGKRFYITPRIRVYGSEEEAREAAQQWSDAQVRNDQGQARYNATRQRMYLVDERENHFTYGGQTKRPLRYFYWPRNADTGHKRQHIYKFDTREEALAAAQQMSNDDVFNSAPRDSGDPLRPGFFHYPEQRYFDVRFKNPQGRRVNQRFKYNEQAPSYENNNQAREAALNFIEENIRRSTSIPRPGQTFRMILRNLLNIGHLVNRERFPFVFSPGLDFENREVPIDPYYLGAWLGDGERRTTGIANLVGPEIVDWLVRYAAFLGMRVTHTPPRNPTTHHIVKDPAHVWNPDYVPQENNEGLVYIPDVRSSRTANKVYLRLLALNVTRRGISGTGPATDLKHIPDIFKFNSRQIRLKVLAGLMDTDGSYNKKGDNFSFNQSAAWHSRLFHDTVFLARSLGFYCARPVRGFYPGGFPETADRFFEKWTTQIYGDIEEVPCQVGYKKPRQRQKKRSHLQLSVRTYFEVAGENAQEFFSIQTENNEPFLRDDFLVLLPSRNNGLTEEQEVNNRSYQSLLEDDEVLPDQAIYSGVQASGGLEEEGDNITILDFDEDEDDQSFYTAFQDYDEEFGVEEDVLDEETALMRAIEESRETALRERALFVSGGGESSSSAAGPSSSSAAGISSSQQQESRKGKGREFPMDPEVDPKRRRFG